MGRNQLADRCYFVSFKEAFHFSVDGFLVRSMQTANIDSFRVFSRGIPLRLSILPLPSIVWVGVLIAIGRPWSPSSRTPFGGWIRFAVSLGVNSQCSALQIDALQRVHSIGSIFLGLELDKAVAWIAASLRIDRYVNFVTGNTMRFGTGRSERVWASFCTYMSTWFSAKSFSISSLWATYGRLPT